MNERLKELIEQAGLSALLGNNWLYGEELEEFADLVRQDYLRELRDMKPVAIRNSINGMIEVQWGESVPLGTKLYALDEVKHES